MKQVMFDLYIERMNSDLHSQVLTLYSRLKIMTNDGNLFSFLFFVNSIYTSD